MSADFGVAAGDRLAIYSQNTTNTFEVQFACWKLGAGIVPLNWRLALPELEFIARDVTPKLLFHEAALADAAEKLADGTGIGGRIAWDGRAPGAAEYEALLASVSTIARPAVTNVHDTLACVLYTSGTTGRPKGAMLTHGNMIWNTINATAPFRFCAGMVNLSVLPLFHIGGLNAFANPAFQYGGTNLIMRAFDPARTLQVLADPDAGVTHFLAVPANYLFMSQDPEFERAAFPTLVTAGIGGSPTPIALLETWAAKGVILQQGYGMTESAATISAQFREDATRTIGSVGTPLLHLDCRVVDPAGADVRAGDVGELWARGPNITPGYWNRPEANAESFTDDWFHTGDAVRQDGDGTLYILDRWKDMYISGGENVYPAEVENVIYQLPGIAEAAVIGVPDDRWGEVGKAVIVLTPAAMLGRDDITAHCVANLAKYKVPKSIEFIDVLPRNASGKVLKRDLRDRFTSAG